MLMFQDWQAKHYLAVCYENGLGVDKNIDEARSLYYAAANAGVAESQHNLAVFCQHGYGGTTA